MTSMYELTSEERIQIDHGLGTLRYVTLLYVTLRYFTLPPPPLCLRASLSLLVRGGLTKKAASFFFNDDDRRAPGIRSEGELFQKRGLGGEKRVSAYEGG